MIDRKTLALFRERYKSLTTDGRGDDRSLSTRTLTLGMVVNTDDPMEEGRLQIFCPALNDNPKKIQHLPWAAYVTPFGGSIKNSSFTRGTGDGTATSEGAVHYGFWGVPELGAHVLVGCIDGDPRRRFWIGCIPEHQETHTLFTGRFDWSSGDGSPDGPLTSDKEPIQPLYDNLTKAFLDRKAREWKTRGADYQPMSVAKDGNGSPSKNKGSDYLDDTYDEISAGEDDAWVKDVLGSHGYDWTSFKNAGPFKSSKVFGFSTPGFHSLSMDDRPFNLRTKLRSATGHMILMDDTNERIYIMTNKGNNWIEMDSNGNVDIFSERRVSINSTSDINLTSAGSIRMHAGESIHMYAGHNDSTGDTGDEPLLTEPPIKGEIRIQSGTDLHMTGRNIRQKTIENNYLEVGLTDYAFIGDSLVHTVRNDINLGTIDGDYILTSAKNIFSTAIADIKSYAEGKISFGAYEDAEMQSFSGALSFSSDSAVKMKSMNSDIDMQAGTVSGSGGVKMFTPKSQHLIGDDGIHSMSSADITHTTGGEVCQTSQPGFTVSSNTAANPLLAGSGGLGNMVKINQSNISVDAQLGDVIHKTAATAHSYTALSTQVDTLTAGVNTLSYQTSSIAQAVEASISALGGSVSMPISFDLGCLTSKLFALMPPELLNAYATLEDLNAALQAAGYAVTTLENLWNTLHNQNILDALGLPTINTSINFSIGPCLPGTPLFSGTITPNIPFVQESQNLRALVDSIFKSGAPLGSAPALTPLSLDSPCPTIISPPRVG